MVDKAHKFSAFSIANYKETSQSKINTLMFTSVLQRRESRITSNDALFSSILFIFPLYCLIILLLLSNAYLIVYYMW